MLEYFEAHLMDAILEHSGSWVLKNVIIIIRTLG